MYRHRPEAIIIQNVEMPDEREGWREVWALEWAFIRLEAFCLSALILIYLAS